MVLFLQCSYESVDSGSSCSMGAVEGWSGGVVRGTHLCVLSTKDQRSSYAYNFLYYNISCIILLGGLI